MVSNSSADKDAVMAPLFVYGSLVDADHRAEIIGRRVDGFPATLGDFERGRSRHWYIRRRAGSTTVGLILMGLTAADFALLDGYEEVPSLYTREQMEVTGQHGAPVRCWVYLPTEWAPAPMD